MNRGAWHQFGNNSQKLAVEQLQHGAGAGVIISARDLAPAKLLEYAPQYRALGASVILDQQFYLPDSDVGKLADHPISRFRESVSKLNRISDADLASLQAELQRVSNALGTDAILAPALVYESGRRDIVDVNEKLFRAAKAVGDNLSRPTYATVVLGAGATTSDHGIAEVLDAATALAADGWYFAYEFDDGRVPSSEQKILRWAKAGLTLATTGKPLLAAFAGPLALLAPSFGATAAGVGHSQNLWKFDRSRFQPPPGGGGGGGDAPPRFFSSGLWGTIVYPDEIASIGQQLANEVLCASPFRAGVTSKQPFLEWSRWESNKHLVYVICRECQGLFDLGDPLAALALAKSRLVAAVQLHSRIVAGGLTLKDDSFAYQKTWHAVLARLESECAVDYEYLTLLR